MARRRFPLVLLSTLGLMAGLLLMLGNPSDARPTAAGFKNAGSSFCDRHPDHRKCSSGSTSDWFCDQHPDHWKCPATPTPNDGSSPTADATPTTDTSPTAEATPTASDPTPTTADPTPTSDPSPTASDPTPTTEPSPTASDPTPTASSATCTDPAFVTSDSNGMWNDGGYVVHNNMWNISGYNVSETLSACAYDNWEVTATADNRSGDGAVKTYPNVHKDYHDWSTGSEPSLSSFSTIKSTFAATSPHTGIYNVAYDIWLNGVPGNREIMIWTDNYNQVPAGSRVASSVTLSGHTWDVYATSSNGYIALVPSQPMTQGSLDLKAILDWLTAQGRIPANSTLGQICFGVEVVSTGGQPATFRFTDFSVTDG